MQAAFEYSDIKKLIEVVPNSSDRSALARTFDEFQSVIPHLTPSDQADRLKEFHTQAVGLLEMSDPYADPGSPYRFPNVSSVPQKVRDRVGEATDATLLEMLGQTVRQIQTVADADRFQKLRQAYALINREMNERQVLAPSARPSPKVPPKGLSEWQSWLSNDNQVLDLHWVFSRGDLRSLATSDLADLLQGRFFNFGVAGRLMTYLGSADSKADLLGLPFREAVLLRVIVSKAHRETIKSLRGQAHELKRQLIAVAIRDHRYRDARETWPDFWLAEAILSVPDSSSWHNHKAASKGEIGTYYGLLRGDRCIPARTTIANKLTAIRKFTKPSAVT